MPLATSDEKKFPNFYRVPPWEELRDLTRYISEDRGKKPEIFHWLGGGFKSFLFSPPTWGMIQFDEYFSDGLKPPTSIWINFFQLKFPEAPDCRCEGSRWPFPCKDFGMASTSLWGCGWEEWAGWWGFGLGFRELETLGVSILQTWAFHAKGRLAPMASRFSIFWCVLKSFEVFKMLIHFTDCTWHLRLCEFRFWRRNLLDLRTSCSPLAKISFSANDPKLILLFLNGTSWHGHQLKENPSNMDQY